MLMENAGGKVRRGQQFVERVEWLNDDKELHRTTGPAAFSFSSSTGKLVRAEWRESGKLHRLDGPALVFFKRDEANPCGGLSVCQQSSRWFIDGEDTGGPSSRHVEMMYRNSIKQGGC